MEWGFTNSEPEFWDCEDGYMCWRENKFLTFQWLQGVPGFHRFKYDGIPYYVLSFGIFCINWGRYGTWIPIASPVKEE